MVSWNKVKKKIAAFINPFGFKHSARTRTGQDGLLVLIGPTDAHPAFISLRFSSLLCPEARRDRCRGFGFKSEVLKESALRPLKVSSIYSKPHGP